MVFYADLHVLTSESLHLILKGLKNNQFSKDFRNQISKCWPNHIWIIEGLHKKPESFQACLFIVHWREKYLLELLKTRYSLFMSYYIGIINVLSLLYSYIRPSYIVVLFYLSLFVSRVSTLYTRHSKNSQIVPINVDLIEQYLISFNECNFYANIM